MANVLVYGTLKRHGSRHGRMAGSKLVREVIIDGFDMYNVPDGDYPAIVRGKGRIHAELYIIDEATLRGLDVTEGYLGAGEDNLYDRVEVSTMSGEMGWIYVASPRLERAIVIPRNKIASGRWDVHER
nr:gamma-glutamylcyclotransferase family protein [Candidatus Sigynarchaeota archaeon]